VLVVGAGAIGGYVGARLALAGHAVTLVGRAVFVDAVLAHGLRLIAPDGEWHIERRRATTALKDACADDARFDLALLAVKTYDTAQAIEQLRPYADRIEWFWSLQNGVENEDLLGEAFGRTKIIAGTILNPVSMPEPGWVRLEKLKGGIGLAALDAPARRVTWLSDVLAAAGFRVRAYGDYRAMKWSKLLLNLIGNASSAILDRTTLELFRDKLVFAIEIAALRETLRVARAHNIGWVSLPGYPVPLMVAALRLLPLPILQPLMQPLVAKGRGNKMPSLHADLATGKPGSEVDALNGVVVRLGESHGVDTPANALLLDTLHALQSGRASRATWRHRADKLWIAYQRRMMEGQASASHV
jgi:2-dehydropantoate 2-reductase